MTTDIEEYGLYGLRMRACACIAGLIWHKALREGAAARQSVIDLIESVIPAIIKPIDEDGSVRDAWAILAPSLETGMRSGKGSNRRPLPGEVSLGAIRAKKNCGAAIAATVAPGLLLARIANIKDANGAHEIEFRPADINVGAVFYELESVISPHEVVPGRVGAFKPKHPDSPGCLIEERG